jgi:Rrf2 family protein
MALIELATRDGGGPVQIKEISEAAEVPRQFLAKIIQVLVKARILQSSKGRGGGIRFARPASEIMIAEIVRAVDGNHALQNCIFGLRSCDGTRNCPIHPSWGPIRDQVLGFLEGTSLADLAGMVCMRGNPKGWACSGASP